MLGSVKGKHILGVIFIVNYVKSMYIKICNIKHYIQRALLNGNYLRGPLNFTIPSTGNSQLGFRRFCP